VKREVGGRERTRRVHARVQFGSTRQHVASQAGALVAHEQKSCAGALAQQRRHGGRELGRAPSFARRAEMAKYLAPLATSVLRSARTPARSSTTATLLGTGSHEIAACAGASARSNGSQAAAPTKHRRAARVSAKAIARLTAKRQVHPPHAEALRNVLHQYLSRTGIRESTAERVERARAEPAGQAMDFDAGLWRLPTGHRWRPNVNAISVRGKSQRRQPRVIRDAALLRRILAGYDVPSGQSPRLLRLARSIFQFLACSHGWDYTGPEL